MSKSVLVIDTPENCLNCQFCYELGEGVEACCSIMDDGKDKSLMKKIDCEYGYCQSKPDWCPLKPLPEKMTIPRGARNTDDLEYAAGYNTCINEIAGEVK